MRTFGNRILGAFSVFLALSLYADAPGGFAGAFLEFPPMASSVAVGNAVVTFDPEPAALFSNPANLFKCCKIGGQASVERLSLSTMRYALAGSYQYKGWQFAVGYLQHSIEDIQGRDEIGALTGKMSFDYQAYALGAAWGREGGKRKDRYKTAFWQFSAGTTLELLGQSDIDTLAAAGYTVNVGISGRYGTFRYGLLIRNLVGGMVYENSSTSAMPGAFIVGAGYEWSGSNWAEISLENKVSGRLRWRLGGQFMPTDWAAFRAGVDFSTGKPLPINETRFAGGGALYFVLGVPMELSYAAQYISAVRGFGFSSSLSINTF